MENLKKLVKSRTDWQISDLHIKDGELCLIELVGEFKCLTITDDVDDDGDIYCHYYKTQYGFTLFGKRKLNGHMFEVTEILKKLFPEISPLLTKEQRS